MNRITNEQREAIVRKAIAERDSLLVGVESHPPGFDAWWDVFFALAGKDKAWPVKQAAREAFAALAPTAPSLPESRKVTEDARDADRYRAIRDGAGDDLIKGDERGLFLPGGEVLDAAIDAVLSLAGQKGGAS